MKSIQNELWLASLDCLSPSLLMKTCETGPNVTFRPRISGSSGKNTPKYRLNPKELSHSIYIARRPQNEKCLWNYIWNFQIILRIQQGKKHGWVKLGLCERMTQDTNHFGLFTGWVIWVDWWIRFYVEHQTSIIWQTDLCWPHNSNWLFIECVLCFDIW